MEKFEIRKAKQKDKKDILKIFESYKPNHWDLKSADEHFTRFFESNDFPHDKFFVGLMDSKIVSVIGYYYERVNDIGWLEWFYTHKDYSNRGIGRIIFDFVISELKVKKAKKIFVVTSSDDFYERAVNFYQKMGFKKVDVKINFYGKGEHQIIMCKYC